MLVSLYLSHGIGRKTTAAVVGTGLALVLTAALTAGFVAATSLTGLASENALDASFQAGGLSLRGLLLAGIIIGGLGVLDDVTMSQASLVFQLRRADPTAGFGKLVTGALAVGRDHIAATVNTLFLAYAGASLPLLVLFTTGGDALGTVATAEAVAVEVVRTLCGSIGLIAAVPLTTLLAAALTDRGAQTALADTGLAGRAAYSPVSRLSPVQAQLLFDHVLALHGPRLSHATVGVPGRSLPQEDGLPADARQAANELRRLAATTSRSSGPWYRRALTAGTVRLDLRDPGQLDLLHRYGPFSTDARVWVEGDPLPVVQAAETLEGQPRITYRLEPGEFDRLRATLDEAGLPDAALAPRRSRVRAPT
jgi:YibE/F-like protein